MKELYHFPECKKYENPRKQAKKIKSELKEFRKAKGLHKMDECWDIIHACETWIRNNSTQGQARRSKFNVEKKNRKRDYYG